MGRLSITACHAALLAVCGLTGCVIPAMRPVGVDDPPWLSPYQRSLNSPQPRSAPVQPLRPGANDPSPAPNSRSTLDQPQVEESRRTPSQDQAAPTEERRSPETLKPEQRPEESDSPASREPAESSSESGPALPELRGPSPWTLTVNAPEAVSVGDAVLFEIELTNQGGKEFQTVRVECDFDESLVFQQKDEKRVARTFEALPPGESRRFKLSLTATASGRQCCRFSVLEGGTEQIWKSVCVEVTERTTSLSVVGPRKRLAGDRAEFTVKAVNVTQERVSGLVLAVRSELALKPYDWSRGATQADGVLRWNLGTLLPGEGAQIQVEYDCAQPTEEACITAMLESPSAKLQSVTECLRVRAAPQGVRVTLADTTDPLPAGEAIRWELTIANRGLEPLEKIETAILPPPGLGVISWTATVGERAVELGHVETIDGLRLSLTEALPVDATLTVVLQAKAAEPGDYRLTARVTAGGLESPIEVDETSTVNLGAAGETAP